MSFLSKILESTSKHIAKELDKQAQKSASQNASKQASQKATNLASKNLPKPSPNNDIMPLKNLHSRGQMQDNIIKKFGTNYAKI